MLETILHAQAEIIEAVKASGEIILEQWDKPRNITHKGRIDLVTETDVAVEEDLKRRLSAILPQASFLAEESASKAPLEELTWIIDPVDGTTNFAHKLPFVATSVGLWYKDQIVLGVINLPVMQECFWAAKGQGAFCNGERIATSRADSLERSVLATGFPYAIEENVDEIVNWLRRVLVCTQGVRRYGAAAADLAYVAAGKLDGFYEIALNPWDVSAGWLLVEEAGGCVTNLDSNGDYDLYARGILATNGLIHNSLYNLLQGN